MQKAENQKHVVVLLGSPRKKGNSTVLAKQIIHGVESIGANEPGEIASNAELMAQAEEIGKKLAMN